MHFLGSFPVGHWPRNAITYLPLQDANALLRWRMSEGYYAMRTRRRCVRFSLFSSGDRFLFLARAATGDLCSTHL